MGKTNVGQMWAAIGKEAAKPVWAKQLTRLPCLVVYVKSQFVSNQGKLFRLLNESSVGLHGSMAKFSESLAAYA